MKKLHAPAAMTMDRFGGHAEGCMGGGDSVLRHNDINFTLCKQARVAATQPEMEKSKVLSGIISERSLNGRQPADTLLNNGIGIKTARNRNMPRIGLDVGVVNPQAASHLTQVAGKVQGAAEGYTQTKRDRNDTDALCAAAGIGYQPIVWESFGGVSEEGRNVIRSLNRLVASNTNAPIGEVAHRFWHRISVDIQKANHKAFAKRVAKAAGVGGVGSQAKRFLWHSRVVDEMENEDMLGI